MGSLVEAAEQIATRLQDVGVAAYVDPHKAAARRPCVLVPPPAVDYVNRTNTWRLVALSAKGTGDLAALRELDELVQDVVEALHIEAADPGSYQLAGGTDPVPAYILRLTT